MLAAGARVKQKGRRGDFAAPGLRLDRNQRTTFTDRLYCPWTSRSSRAGRGLANVAGPRIGALQSKRINNWRLDIPDLDRQQPVPAPKYPQAPVSTQKILHLSDPHVQKDYEVLPYLPKINYQLVQRRTTTAFSDWCTMELRPASVLLQARRLPETQVARSGLCRRLPL